jgi:hypothetical protein
MAHVAPTGRKHLSADALFRLVYAGFDHIPDHRPATADIPLTDALMSAEGNLRTLYGIQRVPGDTHMREILAPVAPEALRPVFKRVVTQVQRSHALEPRRFVDDSYLLALDGTGYFSSKAIPCASCLQQMHRDGTITYAHQMLGAAIIHSRRTGRDSLDAGTDRAAGRHAQK